MPALHPLLPGIAPCSGSAPHRQELMGSSTTSTLSSSLPRRRLGSEFCTASEGATGITTSDAFSLITTVTESAPSPTAGVGAPPPLTGAIPSVLAAATAAAASVPCPTAAASPSPPFTRDPNGESRNWTGCGGLGGPVDERRPSALTVMGDVSMAALTFSSGSTCRRRRTQDQQRKCVSRQRHVMM
jgi:hypothetical protein